MIHFFVLSLSFSLSRSLALGIWTKSGRITCDPLLCFQFSLTVLKARIRHLGDQLFWLNCCDPEIIDRLIDASMDPELFRIAQEQMSKIPPSELEKLQQQMMSNPELIKMASESMKNMRVDDWKIATEQFKNIRQEDIAEMSQKIAKASPEEIAVMQTHAEAQITYELNAAEMLKKQGNELHSRGKYSNAVQKYLLAKNNLKALPVSKGRALQLACSLNLMSCYLKTKQYDDCIREGFEVLDSDPNNIKALYRRGQAYKEIGELDVAASDLGKAHSLSPDDETIADVLREVKERLTKEGSQESLRGLTIEEICEEESQSVPSEHSKSSSSQQCDATQSLDANKFSHEKLIPERAQTFDSEPVHGLKDNPEAIRSFQKFMSTANAESLAAMSGGEMSSDMIKTASEMISKMSPEELQKMISFSSSLHGKNSFHSGIAADSSDNRSKDGLQTTETQVHMAKAASDMISKMSPDELQNMLNIASSLNGNLVDRENAHSRSRPSTSSVSPDMIKNACDMIGKVSPEELQNLLGAGSSSNGISPVASLTRENNCPTLFPNSSADLSPTDTMPTDFEQIRNQMKEPAMQEMFTTMIKSMNPETMARMMEQFGLKMSREEAMRAHQAMSSLSPQTLDKMMLWTGRAQRAVDGAKKTKNWLLGKPGMVLAICILILAMILHRLGYIGS